MNDVETLRTWFLFFTWTAAIGTTVFPILYSFSPWYKSKLGQMLMLQAIAFALAVDLSLVSQYGWYPQSFQVRLWVGIIVFGLIAFASMSLTYLLWQTNHLHPIRRYRKTLVDAEVKREEVS